MPIFFQKAQYASCIPDCL